MNIDENSRLGAVLFYGIYTNRQSCGKSIDITRKFADILYADYDAAKFFNEVQRWARRG